MRLKTLFREYEWDSENSRQNNIVSGVQGNRVLSGIGTNFTSLVVGADIEVETEYGVTTYIGKVAEIVSDTVINMDRNLPVGFLNKIFWVDWSLFRLTTSSLSRRIESDNPGEGGAIVFDDVSLQYYFGESINIAGQTALNPVYQAFQGDHDVKRIFLIRRVALNDQSAITTFEGMVNFSKISYPDIKIDEEDDLIQTISLEVKDKLSALSLLETEVSRTELPLSSRILITYPAAKSIRIIYPFGGTSYKTLWIRVRDIEGNAINMTDVILQPGELLKDPSTLEADEPEYFMVTKSVLETISGDTKKQNKIEVAPVFGNRDSMSLDLPNTNLTVITEEYYGVNIINYDVNGVPESLNALELLKLIIKKKWPDVQFTNKIYDDAGNILENFPIPLYYYDQLRDEYPLGKEPLDALVYLANSMLCYIYFDRLGYCVVQRKNKYPAAGNDKTIPYEFISESTKNEVWDKLVDAVTVKVLSCIYDDDLADYLIGESTYQKKANTKPRNELSVEMILDTTSIQAYGMSVNDSGKLVDPDLPGATQQEILDKYAGLRAVEFFNFYGKRHENINTSLSKINPDVLQWDMMDIFLHGVNRYFLSGLELNEVEETLDMEIVGTDAFNYDLNKISIPKMNENYTGGGRSSSLGNSGGGSSIILTDDKSEVSYIKTFQQWKSLFNSPLTGSKKVILTGSFNLTEKVNVDLNGFSLEIVANPEVKIKSTVIGALYDQLTPDAAIIFTNGKDIKLSDSLLEFSNSGSYTYQNQAAGYAYLEGMLITDCERVILEHSQFNKAGHAGLRIMNCDSVAALECKGLENLYAGLMIGAAKRVRIWGGEYSYNGSEAPSNGYGISLSSRWNSDVDNEDVLIEGVTANYNLRKGIDIHGGIDVRITWCKITGFGYCGIYAVNEAGSAHHYEKFVKDVFIAYNQIKNDAAWYAGLTLCTDTNVGTHPIQTGSFGDVESHADTPGHTDRWYAGGPGGTTKIHHNLISDCSVINSGVHGLKYPISHFGGAQDDVVITENTIRDCKCVYGIYITGNNYNKPKFVDVVDNKFINVVADVIPSSPWDNSNSLIFILNGETIHVNHNPCENSSALNAYCSIFPFGNGAHISSVDIGNTQINGAFAYGIKLDRVGESGEYGVNTASIHDIEFIGTYSGKFLEIDPSIKFTTRNLRANLGIDPADGSSMSLPEYTSAQSGKAIYDIQTSGVAPKTVNTLTVDASTVSGGSIAFEIKIVAIGGNNELSAVYTFDAVAGNIGGAAPTFQVLEQRHKGLIGSASDNIPSVAWDSSGNARTLHVTIPQTYRGCFIQIDFSGWRLTPYQSSN